MNENEVSTWEDEKKFMDTIFALYEKEKVKENFSEELFWNKVEDTCKIDHEKNGLKNFAAAVADLADSIDYDSWRKEQLQQIEELEKDLPEFKKDK